jgi:molybdopterin converting factor small subunit
MSVPPLTAPVRVLLFARYADLLGFETLTLVPASVPTVGAVVEHLRRLPGGDVIPARPLVALNLERASLEQPVGPGDEVAVLPPMAGG